MGGPAREARRDRRAGDAASSARVQRGGAGGDAQARRRADEAGPVRDLRAHVAEYRDRAPRRGRRSDDRARADAGPAPRAPAAASAARARPGRGAVRRQRHGGAADARACASPPWRPTAPPGRGCRARSRATSPRPPTATLQIKWYFGGIAGNEKEHDRSACGAASSTASPPAACSASGWRRRCAWCTSSGCSRAGRRRSTCSGGSSRGSTASSPAPGFTNLGEAGFGSDILFSRTAIRSLDDLRRARLWIWDLDEVYQARRCRRWASTPCRCRSRTRWRRSRRTSSTASSASRAAALAFQWSARARYFSDLRVGYVMGCMVVTHTAFDPLPIEAQQAVQAAAGRLMRHMEDMGKQQDDALFTRCSPSRACTASRSPRTSAPSSSTSARAARNRLAPR